MPLRDPPPAARRVDRRLPARGPVDTMDQPICPPMADATCHRLHPRWAGKPGEEPKRDPACQPDLASVPETEVSVRPDVEASGAGEPPVPAPLSARTAAAIRPAMAVKPASVVDLDHLRGTAEIGLDRHGPHSRGRSRERSRGQDGDDAPRVDPGRRGRPAARGGWDGMVRHRRVSVGPWSQSHPVRGVAFTVTVIPEREPGMTGRKGSGCFRAVGDASGGDLERDGSQPRPGHCGPRFARV